MRGKVIYIEHFEWLIKLFYEKWCMYCTSTFHNEFQFHLNYYTPYHCYTFSHSFLLPSVDVCVLWKCIEIEIYKWKKIPTEIIAVCIRLFDYISWLIVTHKLSLTHSFVTFIFLSFLFSLFSPIIEWLIACIFTISLMKFEISSKWLICVRWILCHIQQYFVAVTYHD